MWMVVASAAIVSLLIILVSDKSKQAAAVNFEKTHHRVVLEQPTVKDFVGFTHGQVLGYSFPVPGTGMYSTAVKVYNDGNNPIIRTLATKQFNDGDRVRVRLAKYYANVNYETTVYVIELPTAPATSTVP
jgi:hypothetical protein